MDLAREGAERGDGAFTVYATEVQTAGRGRLPQRRWVSAPGQALTFTLILRPPLPTFPPSLRLGLGVALWLKSLGLQPQLKWPNDVLVEGRKIAGILVESCSRYALAGIGINLHPPPEAATFSYPPAAVSEWIAPPPPRQALLSLLSHLRIALERPDPLHELDPLLAWRGREVLFRLHDGANWEAAELVGLGAEGELVLKMAGQLRRFWSGEVRSSG